MILLRVGRLPATAKEQVRRGAGVIIAFGMFAKIVRQNVDVPVIMVDICPEDVLDGILKAAELGQRIAIVGFRKVLHGVFRIRSLLNVELLDIPTVMPEELPEVIAGLKKDDVLVGGYYQADLARQYGIPCVVLKPRDEEIRKAISMACSYLEGQDSTQTAEPFNAAEFFRLRFHHGRSLRQHHHDEPAGIRISGSQPADGGIFLHGGRLPAVYAR